MSSNTNKEWDAESPFYYKASNRANSVQAQIERLRQEIKDLEALQQLEQGSKTSRLARNGAPPPPPRKNFAMQEQPSGNSRASVGASSRGVVGKVVGLLLLGGAVAAIVYFVNFLKDNGIQFFQGDPSSTPITLSEVTLHNTPDDCWMVIHGRVYDLTAYAKRHPGGSRIVTDLAGIDATAEYDRFHSISLLDSVQGDAIGLLVAEGQQTDGGNNEFGAGIGNGSDGISFSEVSQHSTPDDCWVVMHNGVYDMTAYANRHPGGARVVTNHCGTDATAAYGRFHSQGLLGSLQNGELQGSLAGAISNGGGTSIGSMGDSSVDSHDD